MTLHQEISSPAEAAARVNGTLLEIQTATWRFAAIRGLLSIGAFDELAAGPLTAGELAGRCGADAAALGRVLRCVAATGLIRSDGRHRYELTAACREAMDGWVFAAQRYLSDPEVWGALGEITETIRTGKPPFVDRHGSMFGYLATQPATAAAFDTMLKDTFAPAASALAQAADFSAAGTVVDVGGGYGEFITAILRTHPGTRGILAELERAVPRARDYLAANGVAARCDVVACDFFTDPLPGGAGAYLLAHVIHDWDDERALAILRAVRVAIPDGGRLLVVEKVLPGDDSPHFAKDLDIHLLTTTAGGERTEPEYQELLAAAGFRTESVTDLAAGDSVRVAVPAA